MRRCRVGLKMPVTRRAIWPALVLVGGRMTMRMVMMTRRMVTVIRTLVELRMQMNMRPIVAVMAMENDAMVFAGRRTKLASGRVNDRRPWRSKLPPRCQPMSHPSVTNSWAPLMRAQAPGSVLRRVDLAAIGTRVAMPRFVSRRSIN